MILAVEGSAHCEQPLISTALQRDWRFANFWRKQEQLAAEMRVPYLLFHSHLPEDQWSLFALIHHQALTFSRIVIEAPFKKIVEHFYHRVQTKTSELTENSNWSVTEHTHFVQLLITYRNKSAASKSTFICFESSLLFFSTRLMVVSRVLLTLSRSDSLAFSGRWNFTSGIKVWVNGFSVFRLDTFSWTLFAPINSPINMPLVGRISYLS